MNKVEKSNAVVSNDTISKPLEISRHGDSHIVETLEEAAGNYPSIIRTISPQWESEIEMAFKAGAQWQKEQDQSTIELAEDHAMLAGMERMKQEMMEDAVKCNVGWCDGLLLDYTQQQQDKALDKIGAKIGDKVKLIIIKEE